MRPGHDFTHVIMTRFNMAMPQRDAIRKRPGWLESRFDLFERYCLPSIAAQTTRDFHWVIYFDIETPASFRERIERCRAEFPFIPFYTPHFEAEGWPRSLREIFGTDRTPWLVTSRLDNDDALSVDHVERLHGHFLEQGLEKGSVNFRNGFLLQGERVYALEHLSNAFAHHVEPWDEAAITCRGVNHLKLAEFGPVRQIGGAAAWLQVVHGGNVSNKVRGRRVSGEEARGLFPDGVLGPLRPVSPLALGLENLVLVPARNLRDSLAASLRGQKRLSR
jgi:hypothetical protein